MSIVWPCPLTVDAYASMGRAVQVPRPDCPSCLVPTVFWSGYWRYIRWQGQERKIFIRRVRCRGLRGDVCAVAGVHAGPAAGRGRYGRRGDRAGRGRSVRGAAGGGRGGGAAYDGAGLGAPGRVAGRGAGGEFLGPVRRAGRGCRAAAARSAAVSRDGGLGGVRGGGRAAGVGGAGPVAVRQRGDRREPAGRQRVLALA